MKPIPLPYSILIVFLALLIGCAAGGPSPSAPSTEKPDTTSQSVAVPSQNTIPTEKPDGPAFNHRSPRDTVDWESTNVRNAVPVVKETDREWPGERLGLIGPIIAKGGAGSKRYLLVFDPAGVLVGGLTYKEFEENPQRLDALIEKAQIRGEHQNFMALHFLVRKRLAEDMAARQSNQGGRHEK